MSDIAKGVGNLFASVVEIIKGIVTTIFGLFQGALNAAIGLLKNVFNLAEGVLGFIIGKFVSESRRISLTGLGNLFIIGTLCAVYFGYVLYQERQGKRPAPISKALSGKAQ